MFEPKNPQGFNTLNIEPRLLAKLSEMRFTTPTPIQAAAIPYALLGRDVVGIAQTGTGKTLAFGLPMLSRLRSGQFGLVLAPTRELAQQIQETLKGLGARTALLIGGAPMGPQLSQLRNQPNVVVATPGRLIDHMERRSIDFRRVGVAVLDEADRMLDMGFAPSIRRILDQTPRERQTMLFSATMPSEIAELAERYLRKPERVAIEGAGHVPTLVEQELMVLPQLDKAAMLSDLLDDHKGSVLVFARTRHGARKLARHVRSAGHSASEMHSDRTLAQRREALSGFKSGTYRVLVATDIAARGIDVKEIALVVNYDVPEKPEDYVHRIGRTGRAGVAGRAITFATPEQHGDVRDIEKLLRSELALSDRSPLPMPAKRVHGATQPRSSTRRSTRSPGRSRRRY